MKPSRPSSAPASATQAATAPKSESAYLNQQATSAKQAFKQTLGEIGSGIGRGVSPAAWTGEHPWVMLSSAVVAGFVAAAVAVPSKEQAAMRKLAELERALHPQPPSDNRHESNGHGKQGKGLLGFIITQAMQGAVAVIAGVLQGKKTAHEAQQADSDAATTES